MKKKESIIRTKTFFFSVQIMRTCKYLRKNSMDIEIIRQLLRSGTSIGANVEEAHGAQSKRDFKSKMFIVYKEARETRYWLRLLKTTQNLEKKKSNELLNENEEICKILGKILHSLSDRK